MKIREIDAFAATLPFRFSFGHSLASRAQSTNVIVRVRLEDGTEGYGEGIPRAYVTGEEVAGSLARIRGLFASRLLKRDIPPLPQLLEFLAGEFLSLELDRTPWGASWCALELAVLDAVARAQGLPLAQFLGPARARAVRYGAVVPLCGGKALIAILLFYKIYGFKTVKVKVGKDLDQDLARLGLARRILGDDVVLRVDANCAWSADQALAAAEKFRKYGVVSIEQPVAADDLTGLARVTSCLPEQIIADESLCTIEQARMLAEMRSCTGFNIRLSKVGGILAARTIAAIARKFGIACHLGAQVGESGILSAAGRLVAFVDGPFENLEGSANAFLLKRDLTCQDLTVGLGGWGDLPSGPGLGVNVRRPVLSASEHGLIEPEPLSGLELPARSARS